jgi:general secretion pathway protein K
VTGRLPRQRGAALLLVLWLVAMLAALVGAFALIAQIERLQGRTLFQGVVAGQAARAGLEYAVVRATATDPARLWLPDGRTYRWSYGGAEVEVAMVDENGKVDLNLADAVLLGSLLQVVGAEPQQAARLAGAIIDWRDTDTLTHPSGGAEDAQYAEAGLPYGAKDGPFEGKAELRQVLGMTSELYAAMSPHVTVFSGRMRPDPAFASSQVLAAMGLEPEQVLALRGSWDQSSGMPPPMLPGFGPVVASVSGTYSIESRARLADGRRSLLRAVVRTGGTAVPGSVYTPLHWEEGASL